MTDKELNRKMDEFVKLGNELHAEAKRRYGRDGSLFHEAEGGVYLMDGDSDGNAGDRQDHIKDRAGINARWVRGMVKMNWFVQHRMEWIAETLRVFGFINREHLMRKFNISTPQASKDLSTFRKMYPHLIEYDLTGKRFVPPQHPGKKKP